MDNESQRLERIFDQTIVGIAQVNNKGEFRLVNDRFCEIVGRPREDLLKLRMQDITHPEDLPGNLLMLQELFHSGKSFVIEKRYVRPDGSHVWVRNNVSHVIDPDGSPSSVSVTLDITEQKDQARIQETIARRDKFLSEVGMVLSSSLDFEETLHRINRLAIPDFGDWCYIHLENSKGDLELIRSCAVDPGIKETLTEFAAGISATGSKPNAVKAVHQSGKGVLRNELDDAYYQKVAYDARQLELFRKLSPKSVIVVPLKSLGKLRGTITVSYSQNKPYSDADYNLIEEVALRAGLALDNARLYEESRQAIASRDEFVSLASHELKTPLTSLMLLNQMTRKRVDRGELSGANQTSLQQVFMDYEAHIFRIAKLVDDMLDITRIQLGTYSLSLEKKDFGKFLKNAVAGFLSDVTKAQAKLDLELSGDLEASFDEARFHQVISNLVTNALKYAPGSPIIMRAEGLGDKIILQVRDKGPGIETEDLEKIFQRFERARSRNQVGGLGLGLYISRRIIEAHQGKIWAESSQGKGTSIIIEFPRN